MYTVRKNNKNVDLRFGFHPFRFWSSHSRSSGAVTSITPNINILSIAKPSPINWKTSQFDSQFRLSSIFDTMPFLFRVAGISSTKAMRVCSTITSATTAPSSSSRFVLGTAFRRMSTSTTLTWLKNKGFSDDVALGIMKAFPTTPTVPEIQAMGDAGLASLAEAVMKDVKKLEHTATVNITVKIPHENKVLHIAGKEGQSLYDLTTTESELAHSLECACRGIAACSTCHVYVAKEFRDKLPPPEENELDMLDLAWGVKKSSRLGCQIKLSKEVEGLTVKIPAQSNNLFN